MLKNTDEYVKSILRMFDSLKMQARMSGEEAEI